MSKGETIAGVPDALHVGCVPETLDEAFAAARVQNASIRFIDAKGGETVLTASELWDDSLSSLADLQAKGVGAGEKAIIFIDDPRLFLIHFWACILGGIVPCPLTVNRTAGGKAKFVNVCRRILPAAILAEDSTKQDAEQWLAETEISATVLLSANERQLLPPEAARRRHNEPDDLAFIQFSSGSTGDPKGVLLTHRNLVENVRAIGRAMTVTPSDRSVSWLPLTHDMGLIGFHLTSLLWTVPQTIISPKLFFRSPMRWIACLSKEKATISGSPSFGLRHVLRAMRRSGCPNVDLSALRLLVNGAEPVSWPLCEAFLDAFDAHGLRQEAMFPVYGLAEATVAVTFPRAGEAMKAIWVHKSSSHANDRIVILPPGHPEGMPIVSVGAAVASCQIAILDEDGVPKDEGCAGSIHVSGVSVSAGYYGDPVKPGPRSCDTGDIGVIHRGELYVIGRRKDVYVRDGTKYHLADLDIVCHAAGEEGHLNVACVVVPPVEQKHQERLIAFIEDRRAQLDLTSTAAALNRAVYSHFAIKLDDVVRIPKLPRTTSGKIQRQDVLGWWCQTQGMATAAADKNQTGMPVRHRISGDEPYVPAS
jgi:fengycin family lipopeptide synthetase D